MGRRAVPRWPASIVPTPTPIASGSSRDRRSRRASCPTGASRRPPIGVAGPEMARASRPALAGTAVAGSPALGVLRSLAGPPMARHLRPQGALARYPGGGGLTRWGAVTPRFAAPLTTEGPAAADGPPRRRSRRCGRRRRAPAGRRAAVVANDGLATGRRLGGDTGLPADRPTPGTASAVQPAALLRAQRALSANALTPPIGPAVAASIGPVGAASIRPVVAASIGRWVLRRWARWVPRRSGRWVPRRSGRWLRRRSARWVLRRVRGPVGPASTRPVGAAPMGPVGAALGGLVPARPGTLFAPLAAFGPGLMPTAGGRTTPPADTAPTGWPDPSAVSARPGRSVRTTAPAARSHGGAAGPGHAATLDAANAAALSAPRPHRSERSGDWRGDPRREQRSRVSAANAAAAGAAHAARVSGRPPARRTRRPVRGHEPGPPQRHEPGPRRRHEPGCRWGRRRCRPAFAGAASAPPLDRGPRTRGPRRGRPRPRRCPRRRPPTRAPRADGGHRWGPVPGPVVPQTLGRASPVTANDATADLWVTFRATVPRE